MTETKVSVKCVAVGDGFVGKTSLLARLTTKEFNEQYTATVFDNTSLNLQQNGISYEILFIDTAGQEDYVNLRKQFYENVDVFLVCFSVANDTSYHNIINLWLPELSGIKGKRILVGTKSDLRNNTESIDDLNASGKIFVSKIMASNLASRSGFNYIECSSKTGNNIDDLLTMIINLSAERPNTVLKTCFNPITRIVRRAFCCRTNYY